MIISVTFVKEIRIFIFYIIYQVARMKIYVLSVI